MKTVFNKLNETEIPYAIGVSLTKFKSEGADINNKDYYIIAHKSDKLKLKSSKISFVKSSNDNVIERTMNAADILHFKTNLSLFEKVKHDEHGRVYELKNNSFKAYYNSKN